MLANPLVPVREIRRLPDTLTQQSTLAPVQSGNQLARPAAATAIIPLPTVGMPTIGDPTPRKIAEANPRRVSLIIRGWYDSHVVLLGGPAGDLPNGAAGVVKGMRIVGQEAITLDTTGEVWASNLIGSSYGQTFSVLELVAPVAQAGT